MPRPFSPPCRAMLFSESKRICPSLPRLEERENERGSKRVGGKEGKERGRREGKSKGEGSVPADAPVCRDRRVSGTL